MKLKRFSLILLVLMMMLSIIPINAEIGVDEPANGAKDYLSEASDFKPVVQSLIFRKQIKFENYKGKDQSGTLNFELVPDEKAKESYKHKENRGGVEEEVEDLRIYPGIMNYSYKVPFSSNDYVDETFNKLGRDLIDNLTEGQKYSAKAHKFSNDFLDHALLHEWGRVQRSDRSVFLRVGPLKPEQFYKFGGKIEFEKQKKMIEDYVKEGKKISWEGDPDTEDIVGWKSFFIDEEEGNSKVNPLYDFLGSYKHGEVQGLPSENLLDREDFRNGSMKASEVYKFKEFQNGAYYLTVITRPIALSKQYDDEGNIVSIEKPLLPSVNAKEFADKHDYGAIEDKYGHDQFYGEKILRYRLREKRAEGIDLDISNKEIIVDYSVSEQSVYIFEDEKSADEFYKKGLYSKDEEGKTKYDSTASLSFKDANEVTLVNKTAYTNIKIQKAWNDENNKYKDRPKNINVKILADGKDIGKNVKISEKNKWTYSIKNLPSKKDGKEIEYTIKEEKVAKYNTHIDGNAKDGFVITNTHKEVENPRTGDNSHIGMYIAIVILAALLTLILIIIKKKKK